MMTSQSQHTWRTPHVVHQLQKGRGRVEADVLVAQLGQRDALAALAEVGHGERSVVGLLAVGLALGRLEPRAVDGGPPTKSAPARPINMLLQLSKHWPTQPLPDPVKTSIEHHQPTASTRRLG
eukprot:1154981-Pyramimonas_sp.AAC.2